MDMRLFQSLRHSLVRCVYISLSGNGTTATTPMQRDHFPRVAQFPGVEDVAHAVHDFNVVIAEQPHHAVFFLQPDTMLAAQYTPEVDAGA
jgi:hypothetical protein